MIWFALLVTWLIVAGLGGYVLLSEDRIRWLAGQRGLPEPGLIVIAIAGGAGGMWPVLRDARFAPARRRLKMWVWIVLTAEFVAVAALGWLAVAEA